MATSARPYQRPVSPHSLSRAFAALSVKSNESLSEGSRCLFGTHVGSEVCFRRMRTVNRSIREPCIVSVRLHAQELRFQQRVKRQLTHRPLDAAQTLHLFGFQTQARHFQIFGTQTIENVL